MHFRFIDRGREENLLILPGWAFDALVFPLERFPYNLLIPEPPAPFNTALDLPALLRDMCIERISMLGWSLGGVLACILSKSHSELVQELILVSVRSVFPEDAVADMIDGIRQDRVRVLSRFYMTAFLGQMPDYRLFKKRHERRLLSLWGPADLIDGLNFLSEHPVLPLDLGVPVLLVHGLMDRIAPADCMPLISSRAALQKIIIPDAGHLPFLKQEFYDALHDFKERD